MRLGSKALSARRLYPFLGRIPEPRTPSLALKAIEKAVYAGTIIELIFDPLRVGTICCPASFPDLPMSFANKSLKLNFLMLCALPADFFLSVCLAQIDHKTLISHGYAWIEESRLTYASCHEAYLVMKIFST